MKNFGYEKKVESKAQHKKYDVTMLDFLCRQFEKHQLKHSKFYTLYSHDAQYCNSIRVSVNYANF